VLGNGYRGVGGACLLNIENNPLEGTNWMAILAEFRHDLCR